MQALKPSALCVLLLSACSAGGQVSGRGGDSGCDSVGLQPGTSAYAQCLEDSHLRSLASERMLFKTNNNKPLTMLAQQSTRPLSPLINCGAYSVPLASSPTLCD